MKRYSLALIALALASLVASVAHATCGNRPRLFLSGPNFAGIVPGFSYEYAGRMRNQDSADCAPATFRLELDIAGDDLLATMIDQDGDASTTLLETVQPGGDALFDVVVFSDQSTQDGRYPLTWTARTNDGNTAAFWKLVKVFVVQNE
ncbi:MAG TPA: hypothetical protein VNH45_11195 [Gaiellaceae bacterium]|nr:hypothetical protein [Gaiellaceae bacterium]